MQPQEFVNKWANTNLNEQQSGQAHFLDVCRMVGVEMPGGDGRTETGDIFVFEQSLKKATGHGFADVYYENHFAIEYKAADKYQDLNAAYQQLLQYRENLNNPPLLVVTDINHWEIHSNFPNTQKRVYAFSHNEIANNPEVMGWLRDMFRAPERLHPRLNTEQVTKEAAQVFRLIADNMREWEAEPRRIAFFLTKLVFCLFAEDVGLLPTAVNSPTGIFTHIIEESRGKPGVFKQYVQNLFIAMNVGGNILMRDIPYFNGTLFKVVTVEALSVEALEALAKAAHLNWESIEPSIFGTLFERSLDPNKRAQLGAHYTSREDILLIVEPVLMQPLRYQWDTVQLEAASVRERYDVAQTGRGQSNARNQLLALRERILKGIRGATVLDPACGSGNFLYVSLQMLMDLEKEVIQHPLWAGLQMPTPEVHPRQMYGIEIDPIAHALASIVVWIGYIQWRQDNGYGQSFKEPILEELQDNIVCKDAILAFDDEGNPTEPDWPVVDVIVGNPPFLGGGKMRGELGDEYYERLTKFYAGRLPGFADLVCYWFEKSREQIDTGKATRAGLLATNSIRGGANREVLKRIKETGDIFMAWSDRKWILDGAAVRVSMVGFDNGDQGDKTLDRSRVVLINSDLSDTVDITVAMNLSDNQRLSFMGPSAKGPFDIDSDLALTMIRSSNQNSKVIRPVWSATDIVREPRKMWTIDFAIMSHEEAKLFQLPHEYVKRVVHPIRSKNRRASYAKYWWRYAEPRPGMRLALKNLQRFITTPGVAKHRIFAWAEANVLCNQGTLVFPRDDDYFFGVLHSKLHEVWSLRMGTWLGKGNDPRYTPTTTFETFPFPWSPGSEDTTHPAHAAISAAAKQLHEERHAWLNPEAMSEKQLKERTLTNLYNARQVFRGQDSMKVKLAAADFAPRLDELHRRLDQAVCDAYGWDHTILDDDEEILRRLLALNLERAATQ